MNTAIIYSYRDVIRTDALQWTKKRIHEYMDNNMDRKTLHFTLSYDFVPPENSFLVVLTEDGDFISPKFNNTIHLLSLYKKTKGVETLVFTDSGRIASFVNTMGLSTSSVSHRNKYGMPILKYMLLDAKQRYKTDFIIFINSDILINPFIFHFVLSANPYIKSQSLRLPPFPSSAYLMAATVYDVMEVPSTLSFSSIKSYVASAEHLKGAKRKLYAIVGMYNARHN